MTICTVIQNQNFISLNKNYRDTTEIQVGEISMQKKKRKKHNNKKKGR